MADGSLRFDTEIDESGFNDGASKLGSIAQKASGIAVGAVAGITAAVGAAGAAVVGSANEMQQAMNQFAASTGTSKAELAGYQDVMEGIYKNNYGESFEDIGSAMSTITQQLGKMDDSVLQSLTESAIALRDTFGYEVEESVRASKAMMDQFGISGEKAMNLIANGAQDGLDYSGELIDSINEYSVQFAKVGLSADDMFHIFKSGAESGAFNLDKIGDAVKEFSVRAIDGSNTTVEGFQSLGMNADEMAAKFAAGGSGAREAFQQVIAGLAEMDDPVEQSIAGVNLFGTMWEDLGPDVVAQLADIGDEAYGSKDALEDLKKVRYDDVSSSLATLGKTVMSKFIDPIADKALPVVKGAIDGITEALDPPKTMLEEFVDGIEASNKEIGETVKHAKGVMDNAAGEAAKVEEYKNVLLELNDVAQKTEYQKYQMRTIVSELADSVPQLAAAFDEETASLNLNSQEITNYLEDHANLLQQQAAIEAQTEMYNTLFEAKLNQAKADGAYAAARTKWFKAIEESNGAMTDERIAAEEDYHATKEARKNARDSLRDVQKETRDTAEAIKTTTEALGGEAAAAEKAAKSNKQVAQSGEGATASAEVQKAALEALKTKYEEFRSQLERDIQNKVSLFSGFDGGEDVTVEKMLENLQKQKEGLQNWKSNMETLANEVGTTITPEFYNKILEMGPEAANAVQHMVTTLDQSNGRELLAEMAQTWGETIDFSGPAADSLMNTGKAVETGLTSMLNVMQGAGIKGTKKLANGIANGTVDLETAMSRLSELAKRDMESLKQAMAAAGVEISPEIAQGLEQGGEAAVNAMQALVEQLSGKTVEMGEAGNEGGEAFTEEATGTIEDGSGEVVDAAGEVGTESGEKMQESASSAVSDNAGQVQNAVGGSMRKAEDTALGYYDNFYSVGQNLMTGTAAGIVAKSPEVERVAREAVRKAKDGMKQEGDINSPSKVFRDEVGAMLAAGVAKGIESGTEDVANSSRNLAAASLEAAKEELEIHSPSGVFKKEVGAQIVNGIRAGISQEKKKLLDDMKKLSKNAVSAAKGINSTDADYSDVGASIVNSIADGMEKREEFLSKRMDKIISKAIDKVSSGKEVTKLEKRAEDSDHKASEADKKAEQFKKDNKNKEEAEQRAAAKKYRKRSEQAAKEAERLKTLFSEAGENLSSSMSQGITEEFQRIREELDKELTEISEEYQKMYDDIAAKRDGMKDKMATPSNLYDLDTQLEQIKRYQNGLSKLKNKIPDTLMDQILGMDVADADNFTEHLVSLTDAQLAEYVKKWESIQGQAKGYSDGFFAGELNKIHAGYEQKVAKAMAGAEKKMKSVGKNVIRGLIDGMKFETDNMSKEVQKIAKKLTKSFKDAFKIKSPSKVMADEVGGYLPPGISKGFMDALPKAERQITEGVYQAMQDLQGRIASLQCMPSTAHAGIITQPAVQPSNSPQVQVSAEIHTTVDLDGRTVGKTVTPYVNQYLGEQQRREERGG